MKLLVPPKVFIKLISSNSFQNPHVRSLPIDVDGLEVVNTNGSLALGINNKYFIKVDDIDDTIRLNVNNSENFYIFDANVDRKKTFCHKIKYNGKLKKECFSIIHEYFQKAVEEYFEGKERITIILSTEEIAKKTLSSLKEKNIEYIREEKNEEISFLDLEALLKGDIKKRRELIKSARPRRKSFRKNLK